MKRLALPLLVAGLAAPAAVAHANVLVVSDCLTAKYKPHSIITACGDGNSFLSKLSWSSWGGRTATGTGNFGYNDCTPNCAAGHAKTEKGVTVTLSRKKTCRSAQIVYTKVTISGPKGRSSTRLGCP